MKLKIQSVNDLRLYLFRAPIDFPFDELPLTKLVEDDCEADCLSLKVWIIGESHCCWYQLKGWDFSLVEIFACYEIDNQLLRQFDLKLLVEEKFSQLMKSKVEMDWSACGLNSYYRFNLKENDSDLRQDNFKTLLKMEKDFPAINQITPFTKVSIGIKNKDLHLFSQHDYPNENQSVFTNSIITISDY